MKISDLNKTKSELSRHKIDLQQELSKLNNQVRSNKLSKSQYRDLCEKQNALKQDMATTESRILEVNADLSTINDEAYEKRMAEKSLVSKSLIETLVALRDEYEAFGADATRVASMRRMASEFAVKLTRIIKDN